MLTANLPVFPDGTITVYGPSSITSPAFHDVVADGTSCPSWKASEPSANSLFPDTKCVNIVWQSDVTSSKTFQS